MSAELIAFADQAVMGRVIRRDTGKLSFLYADEWRQRAAAYPLSLSLPIARAEHGHDAIHAFLWGLLPDNEGVLDRWARQFHVSARDPFGLLSAVGEDCAGAVQFVRPERMEAVATTSTNSDVEWLTEEEVGERLRRLRQDHAAWRKPSDTGQFSLAGAQPKTALLLSNG